MVAKGKGKAPKASSSKDLDVQATNDSSSISKRSAERAGYFLEPQFLRPFVSKPQTRAPMINAGYYVRTLAIHSHIDRFLSCCAGREAVIISLGCGFEPSFFRLASRTTLPCSRLRYVDVDFDRLLNIKRSMIKSSELEGLLRETGEGRFEATTDVKAEYILLGSDMSDLPGFKAKLEAALDASLQDSHTLFISEVSLVYMGLQESTAVLQLAASYPHSTALVLEQHLPDHTDPLPYSKTMLRHFSHKVRSPLRGLDGCRSLRDKYDLLRRCGWSHADVKSLQQFWRDALRDPELQEAASQAIRTEPFDEWEELDLFLQHYCIIVANHDPSTSEPPCPVPEPPIRLRPASLRQEPSPTEVTRRGHSCSTLDNGETLVFGGFGLPPGDAAKAGHKRLAHTALYTVRGDILVPKSMAPVQVEPAARQYHTCTSFGEFALLFGGRASPKQVFDDLWRFDGLTRSWTLITPPGVVSHGRYRHAAVRCGSYLLIAGGIGEHGQLRDDAWLFNTATKRWRLVVYGAGLDLRHSHQLVCVSASEASTQVLSIGGLQDDQSVAALDMVTIKHSTYRSEITKRTSYALDEDNAVLARYGHQVAPLDNGRCAVIGGVSIDGLISREEQIAILDLGSGRCMTLSMPMEPRLLVGHAVSALGSTSFCIVGGGLTAFSFGSAFDSKPVILTTSMAVPYVEPVSSRQPVDLCRSARAPPVPTRPSTRKDWLRTLSDLEPVIFRGCSLGDCLDRWTPEYLSDRCGSRKVSIHISKGDARLAWHERNFAYTLTSFSDLLERAFSSNETVYLRSLSQGAPRPANLEEDFPEIAADFQVPEFCRAEVQAGLFSSPLRISSQDLGLWAHYDVLDNILMQIRGRKRVRLWPPSDADCLYIKGSSSQIPDTDAVDLNRFPLYRFARPIETVLEPGDVLFIPSCWIHAVSALEPSVSVNCFFRLQDAGLLQKNDVFGNADLVPFEEARSCVEQAVAGLARLRPEQRAFYLKKLGMELQALVAA